jgi:CBS domain-containing protein
MMSSTGKYEPLTDRMHHILVRSVMTQPVRTTSPERTLLDAAEEMREAHVSGLPVVDLHGIVVGVLSEKDIVRALHQSSGLGSARGLIDFVLAVGGIGRTALIPDVLHRLRNTKVDAVMSRRPVTVDPASTVGEAARLMNQYSVNRLPVEKEGTLVGIVTRHDVMTALFPKIPEPPRKA